MDREGKEIKKETEGIKGKGEKNRRIDRKRKIM